MPDFPRLDATLAYTEEHPESHDQTLWARPVFADDTCTTPCGSACCFAGNALLVEGYTLAWKVEERSFGPWYECRILDAAGEQVEHNGRPADEGYIARMAADLLDLDEDRANVLFFAFNTIDDIRRIIDNWRSGISEGEK